MRTILLVSLIFTSNIASADTFNRKHYEVIKSVVWAADKAEIPRALLLAVCYGESNFNTKLKLTHMDGKTLSFGICQVKLESAQWLDLYCKHKIKANSIRLNDNKINAFYAAKLLKYHLKRYNGNWQLTVDAYNKGTAVSSKSEYVKRFKSNHEYLNKRIPDLMSQK